MRAAFVLAALLTQALSVQCMTWKSCGDNSAVFTPSIVTLNPDPPVSGKDITFTISGQNEGGITVPSGKLEVNVIFMGTPIFQTEWDLCHKTACPITPGPVDIEYKQNLPPIAPPGPYEVKLVARGANNEELMCLLVDFEIQAGWFSRKML